MGAWLSPEKIIELFPNPTPAPQVLPLKRGEDCTKLCANLSPLQGDEKNDSFSEGLETKSTQKRTHSVRPLLSTTLGFEGEGVHFHLFYHGEQAVAAGGR